MELFNNKENEILKFKINNEGININTVEARLILMTKENKNILLIGEIEKDICKFNIPELTLYEKGDQGKIKFEIITEDLYFPVWEDNFEIKSKTSIRVEEMITEIQQQSKPKISVSEAKIEARPIEKEKEPNLSQNKTISKLESAFEKNIPIIKEDVEIPIEKPKIVKFDSFK